MIANYHTHTWRCRHADGTEREYVENAIAAGLKILGFSDHTPQVYPNGFVCPVKMLPEELEGYVDTILDLKREYKADIDILLGLEAEYLYTLWEPLLRLLEPYPIEYMILRGTDEQCGEVKTLLQADPGGAGDREVSVFCPSGCAVVHGTGQHLRRGDVEAVPVLQRGGDPAGDQPAGRAGGQKLPVREVLEDRRAGRQFRDLRHRRAPRGSRVFAGGDRESGQIPGEMRDPEGEADRSDGGLRCQGGVKGTVLLTTFESKSCQKNRPLDTP